MSGFPLQLTTNPALQYNDLLGWTCDQEICQVGLIMNVAAYILGGRIPLPAPISVTNLNAYLAVAGGTLTHSYMGLWKSNGTLIGQTADQSTGAGGWGTGASVGAKQMALVGGPFACTPQAANDFLWAGFYCGTAVLLPTWASASIDSFPALLNIGTTTVRSRTFNYPLADTATLPNLTLATIGANARPFWIGLS